MVIFVLNFKGEKWYDKLFNVKYLPLFHHFKAIYQFPKHIIFLVKIVANAPLIQDSVMKIKCCHCFWFFQIHTIYLMNWFSFYSTTK